jgi:uncharacterized RDD family membrane protein YckC
MNDPNPYSAPSASLADPTGEQRLGGRGERLVAVLIDGLIGAVVFALVLIPVFLLTNAWQSLVSAVMSGQGLPIYVSLGMAVAGFVLFLLVQGYPLANWGQTWGKRLLKLRIVDLEGRKPEFLRLVGLRYAIGQVIALIPILGPVFGVVDALFIFRDDRRCIHDHIAGTRVVVAD